MFAKSMGESEMNGQDMVPPVPAPTGASDTEVVPERSALGRLFGIFVDPRGVFASMRARPRFLLAFLIVLVFQTAFAILIFQTGIVRDTSVAQLEAKGKDPQQIEAMERFFAGERVAHPVEGLLVPSKCSLVRVGCPRPCRCAAGPGVELAFVLLGRPRCEIGMARIEVRDALEHVEARRKRVERDAERAQPVIVGPCRVDRVARHLVSGGGILGALDERTLAERVVPPIERRELRRHRPLARLSRRQRIVAEPISVLLQTRHIAREAPRGRRSTAYDQAENGGEDMLKPATASGAARLQDFELVGAPGVVRFEPRPRLGLDAGNLDGRELSRFPTGTLFGFLAMAPRARLGIRSRLRRVRLAAAPLRFLLLARAVLVRSPALGLLVAHALVLDACELRE